MQRTSGELATGAEQTGWLYVPLFNQFRRNVRRDFVKNESATWIPVECSLLVCVKFVHFLSPQRAFPISRRTFLPEVCATRIHSDCKAMTSSKMKEIRWRFPFPRRTCVKPSVPAQPFRRLLSSKSRIAAAQHGAINVFRLIKLIALLLPYYY